MTFVTAKQIPRDVLLIDISYPMCRVLCARREQKKEVFHAAWNVVSSLIFQNILLKQV